MRAQVLVFWVVQMYKYKWPEIILKYMIKVQLKHFPPLQKT